MRTERLLVYPPKNTDSRERTVLLVFFVVAAFFIGLFSVTRLFLIHWVWLVPLSLGSLVLFMVAVLYFRMREKPHISLWIENDSLFILRGPGLPGESPDRYALSSIRVEPEEEGFPKELRILRDNELLLSFTLLQVRDVTLYREIAHVLAHVLQGPLDRPDFSCRAWAKSSFPVPVSPSRTTVSSCRA